MLEPSYVITGLLILLCILAGLDLWRQVAVKDEAAWEEQYAKAVKHSQSFWNYGYRLEDLELKTEAQYNHLYNILHHIDMDLAPRFVLNKATLRNSNNLKNIEYTRKSRIILHDIEQNDTEIFHIHCEKDGPALRVGVNDYRSDNRDECQIFVSPKLIDHDHFGPQYMFDLIHLDDLEEDEKGAFALRYMGNGMFMKAVPPPSDNTRLPWKLVIGGPSIGAAEVFRLTEDGYLFSSLMGGFFSCAPGQMLSGYSSGGIDSYYRSSSGSKFILEPVSKDIIMTSYALVDLSKKVSTIQSNYLQRWQDKKKTSSSSSSLKTIAPSFKDNDKDPSLTTTTVEEEASSPLVEHQPQSPLKICLAIPMTSKGTDMKDILDSPFWNNIFDSFMRSIDWRSNKYFYRFYIGFDRADDKYDVGDSWSEFREEFKHRAIFRLSEQMMNEESINSILNNGILSLKLMHFDHLESAPSQIVSQLVVTAYSDDFDYFYQINDDTILETPNWAPKLISSLKSNPFISNFGVTGPVDTNNEKIFTHSFIHRTHIDVFGYLFPPSFKNWWSDDWISTVYGSKHTFRNSDVTIKHNVHGQKTGDINRYHVDKSAQFSLENELRTGHVKVSCLLFFPSFKLFID
jgi:hypothetical protein